MSTEEDTPPASPSWMQSQQPKVTESKPPKARKPRRTKAQMAEDRDIILINQEDPAHNGIYHAAKPPVVITVDPNGGREITGGPPHGVVVEWADPPRTLRGYLPLAISVLSLIVAVAALVR